MAAFSHCSFLLSAFCDPPILNSTPFYSHTHSSSHETDTNQSSGMTVTDCNDPASVTITHSPAAAAASMPPVKLENPDGVVPKKKKKREDYRNGSSSKEWTEGRGNKKQKKRNNNSNGVTKQEEKPKITKDAPTGYIHVRARRGEATDSHSLAERVRREKISDRMRMLQRLVPGCDKITGKALVLDEIINYVQSLQNQVEFLTMKLASVNPTMFGDFTMGQGSFLGTPDRLNSAVSPLLPPVPQCSTNQATTFADDYSSSTFFLQGGRSNNNVFSSLDVVGEFWDGAEDQRQKFPNPCDFNTNLWSFQCWNSDSTIPYN